MVPKVLDSLSKRRLENLDTAVSYFSKRISSAKTRRSKLIDGGSQDVDATRALLDLEILLLTDVVSYLKLC